MKKWIAIFLCLIYFIENNYAQQVNAIEYFFDRDTGMGRQIILPGVATSDTVRMNATVSVTQLQNGMHTMYARAKSNSSWSHYNEAFFYINKTSSGTEPGIESAEYFFDKDSGVGKCFPIATGIVNNTVTLTTLINLGNLQKGMHTMNIRVRNTDGKYSQFRPELFYVSNDVNNMASVASGEYFLDHDPGVGMGQPLTKFNFSNPASQVSQAFNLQFPTTLSPGLHYMYIRIKDAVGHWSLFQDSFSLKTLPVTGLSLAAKKKEKISLLNWYTFSENNSSHFEVEKSVNSIGFSAIGNVKAKGNSAVKSDYTFTDAEPATGLNYYRIKEVDIDGKFTYSEIVKLWFDKATGSLSIYPNPATNIVNIKYESNRETAVINVYDAAGKWVKLYRLPASSNLSLNVSELAPGTYTIHISDGVDSQTGKLVKK